MFTNRRNIIYTNRLDGDFCREFEKISPQDNI